MRVLQSSLFLIIWGIYKVFCRLFLSWDLSEVFLKFSIYVLEEKTPTIKWFLCASWSHAWTAWHLTLDVGLDQLTQVLQVSAWSNGSWMLVAIFHFLGRNHSGQPKLKEKESQPFPGWAEFLHKLMGIPLLIDIVGV